MLTDRQTDQLLQLTKLFLKQRKKTRHFASFEGCSAQCLGPQV